MLWRDESKTLFDPCPTGWRVPRSGEHEQGLWYHFTLDNSTWNGSENPQPTDGRHFGSGTVYNGTAWYGAGGWRIDTRGHFADVSKLSLIWSSTPNSTTAYDLYCDIRSITYANAYASRSDGISVRCVRE